METETDREDNDPEYVRSPRKRRKQRRLSRNVDTCVVETPAASANCSNNPQLDRSQKKEQANVLMFNFKRIPVCALSARKKNEVKQRETAKTDVVLKS